MFHDRRKPEGREQAKVGTILTIEEDQGIGEVLKNIILSETEYDVYLATKPSEAVEVLEKVTPSLLLVDFHFSSIDGLKLYDLVQILVGDPLPGIMLCEEPSSPYLVEGLRKRKLFSIYKPFNMDDLLHTIQQAILSYTPMEA